MKIKHIHLALGIVVMATGFFALTTLNQKAEALSSADMAGTYRCWSFNVAGSGAGRCTNPPLALKKDGTYTMSTEKGTYKIRGQTILLSQSKIRGPGTVTEDGLQISFIYNYNGREQTVTYLRETNTEKSGKLVFLELTVKYLKEEGWLDWVSTVELEAIGGKDSTVYTALAWGQDGRSVKGSFKKGVPGGAEYAVFLNTGTDRVSVGKIDLRKKSGERKETVWVKGAQNQTRTKSAPEIKQETKTREIPTIPTDKPKTDSAKPKALPRCNPNIPKYSQPECVD